MLYITRKVEFCASHRLCNPNFSDEQNAAVYGRCSNPHGHGHNYTMEVTIKGRPDPNTGMIIDLKDLKKVIHEVIIEKVDHKNLNVDVDFLQGVIPTTENLVVVFWEILAGALPPHCQLHEIRLWETENNVAYYRGEGAEIVRHSAPALPVK
jgi:6-pyruvoyltetrahydropterin/6-carboxytetrahydropterin synthase